MTTKVVISGDSSGAVKAIERVRKELGALDSVSKAAFSLGGAISAAGLVAYTKGAPESVLPQCVARWQAHDGDGAAVPLESAVWLARAETLAREAGGPDQAVPPVLRLRRQPFNHAGFEGAVIAIAAYLLACGARPMGSAPPTPTRAAAPTLL